MAVASWNEWQNNMVWKGSNTGARGDRGAYDNYVREYKKHEDLGNIGALRGLNDAHGFTAGVASDNAPPAPSGGHHKKSGGGGGGEGGGSQSSLDALIAMLLADLIKPAQQAPAPEPPGAGLSGTILTSPYSRARQRKRSYLTPASAVTSNAPGS